MRHLKKTLALLLALALVLSCVPVFTFAEGFVRSKETQALMDAMQKLTYTHEADDTTMPYRLHVPEGYDPQDTETKYPIILFMHGAGERGDDNTSQLNNVIDRLFQLQSNSLDCIVIAPQCPGSERWVETSWEKDNDNYDDSQVTKKRLDMVVELVKQIQKEYSGDTDRTYVMGISMGGAATWNLLMNHNKMFAAGIPICGFSDPQKAAQTLANVPIWTAHAEHDGVVQVVSTDELVAAVEQAATDKGVTKQITYTRYAGHYNHDCWSRFFEEDGVDCVNWLLSKRLSTREEIVVPEGELAAAIENVNKLSMFKAADLATYKAWQTTLKDNAAAANQYDRITNGIEKLESGYAYYDDLQVFGEYASALDDTSIQAGEPFAATTNTTNYLYMFGGAVSQKKETSTSGGSSGTTKPLQNFNVTGFTFPAYHFKEWDFEGATSNYTWSDMDPLYNAALTTATDANSFGGKMNYAVLDLSKLGVPGNAKVEKFSVDTIGNSCVLVFYNYVDSQNWNAVYAGYNREYWSLNCVNGELQDRDASNRWYYSNNMGASALSLFHVYGDRMNFSNGDDDTYGGMGSNWNFKSDQPITLNFVWNEAKGCYDLTFTWDSGTEVKTLKTVSLDSNYTSGLATKQLPNVMISDIKNNMKDGENWKNPGQYGTKSIAVTYEIPSCDHSFVAVAAAEAELKSEANCASPAVYYKQWKLCGLSAKGIDENETFTVGTKGDCTYVYVYDTVSHWKECTGCGTIDPANPKTAHTIVDGSCVCGIADASLNAVSYAKAIVEAKGFFQAELPGYNAAKTALEGYKDNTNAIDGTTSKTWKEAYDRLSNAISQLATYTYYDDLQVFGEYASDLDDTSIQAGEPFAATTNTTNYLYMFGGAVSQKKDSGISDGRAQKSTHPLSGFNISAFTFPAFHFKAWEWEGAEYNKNWTDDPSLDYTMLVNNNVTGGINGNINYVVLNRDLMGVSKNAKLEKFSVETIGYSGVLVIYNYIDNQNWNAVYAGSRRGYWSLNCVDGVYQNRDTSYRWMDEDNSLSAYGLSLFHTYADRSSYLDSWVEGANGMLNGANFMNDQPITLNFVWNEAKGCYDLTFTWNNGTEVKTLKTVSLDSNYTSGLEISQLGNVMISDIKNDMINNFQYGNVWGTTQVAAAFAEPPCDHRFVAVDVADAVLKSEATCTSPAVYYKQCEVCGLSAKDIDETEIFNDPSGTLKTHDYKPVNDETYHWKECSVCEQIDPENPKTGHTGDPCSGCGYGLTAELAAAAVNGIHAFYDEKLAVYTSYQSVLSGTAYTAAYNRVTNAIAQLSKGYKFYDDGENLGDYKTTQITEVASPVFHHAPLDETIENNGADSAYQVILTFDQQGVGPYGLGAAYNEGNSHLAWSHRHWISLADKAGYEKALNKTDTALQQVIPAGCIVTDFSIDYNPFYNIKIVYNYVDASNYSYILLQGFQNARILAKHVVDGVEQGGENHIWHWNNSIDGLKPESAGGPLDGMFALWSDTDRTYNTVAGAPEKLLQNPRKTLRLVWNEDDQCYHVIFGGLENTTSGAAQVEIALTNALTGGTAELKPLTNIYFKQGAMEGLPLYRSSDGTATTERSGTNYTTRIPTDTQMFKNVMVKYELSDAAKCTHQFTVENAEIAEIKEYATCTTLAVYYKNCALCGTSAKDIDETATFTAGQLLPHDYTWKRNETHHWQECHDCGFVNEDSRGEHDAQPCTICGYTRTPEEIAKAVLQIKSFFRAKADVYYIYLSTLVDYKSNTNPIDSTTTRTWKEAYTRLANALEKLEEGYDFYDDLQVFGVYESDLSEDRLGVGDPFITTTNTTNYLYMYGGALSQKLKESTSGNLVPGGAGETTNPLTGFKLTGFTFPAYHFKEWDFVGATADYNWTDSGTPRNAVLITNNTENGITGKMNYTVLNPSAVGFENGNVLEKFSVDTIGGSGVMVIYNYVDNQNWNAVFAGGSREYWSLNCVNGVLQKRDETYDWWDFHMQEKKGDSLFHSYGDRSSYLDTWVDGANGMLNNTEYDTAGFLATQPITLNFVWNETKGCYDLTFSWDNGTEVKNLKTVSLDSTYTDGLAISQLNNVMITDIKNEMKNGDLWKEASYYGTRGIATTFVDKGHVHSFTVKKATLRYLKSEATYTHGTEYYYSCTCGESVADHAGEFFTVGEALDKTSVMPVILGSKILKQPAKWGEQVLRIVVDYAQVEAFKNLDGLTEYGVIIADLNTLNPDSSGNPNVDTLKGLYSTNAVKLVKSELPAPEENGQRLVYFNVHISEKNYGGRFVTIAYVKDGAGVFHYSVNDLGGDNLDTPIEGLSGGVFSTGIMRVMKAILKDESEDGYYKYIGGAVTALLEEGKLPTTITDKYSDAAALAELIQKYAKGGQDGINVGDEGYTEAKAAASYVFQKCSELYDEEMKKEN